MVDTKKSILIITLNLNSLNTSIKRHIVRVDFLKNDMFSIRNAFKCNDL